MWLNALLPYLGDKSSWVNTVWSIATTSNGYRFDEQCEAKARKSFLGIVSSNATAYTGEPPRYDRTTATLEYEMSAPHFMPDGTTLTTGCYALNLNADFMMCLLGVSKVPDQARIQLSYGTGEVNAATVNVKQTKT